MYHDPLHLLHVPDEAVLVLDAVVENALRARISGTARPANAFKRSRVRSNAGILSIGVLLRQPRGFANQATVHPTFFQQS